MGNSKSTTGNTGLQPGILLRLLTFLHGSLIDAQSHTLFLHVSSLLPYPLLRGGLQSIVEFGRCYCHSYYQVPFSLNIVALFHCQAIGYSCPDWHDFVIVPDIFHGWI